MVSGKAIYPHRPDLFDLVFYQCAPCDAYVGTHKGTKMPLGTLANAELRAARSRAHCAFDPLWKKGPISRRQAYARLANKLYITTKDCHIAKFDLATCEATLKLVDERAIK